MEAATDPAALNNRGVALWQGGALAEAEAVFRQVVRLRPQMAEAYSNLGTALRDQGRLDDAVPCFRRAIALRPDYAMAHKNLATVLLAQGVMPAGWADYEWRWSLPEMRAAAALFPQPRWHGEVAPGRRLLIHAEQGMGDTVQFCRYATLAAERGLQVTLQAPAPLLRLLRTLPGPVAVIETGAAPGEQDLHCPMLSLPLAFGTTLATIPAPLSYLRADPAQARSMHAMMDGLSAGALRVGLAWAGNPAFPADRRRSLRPDQLAPLAGLAGVHLFSLQKPAQPRPPGLAMLDLTAGLRDFADTAALIANLDLVISVDTAVAHVAAALGKPVWLLDRYDCCWRWLAGRDDSPWYPSLRIYRQDRTGDWGGVLFRVVRDLRAISP